VKGRKLAKQTANTSDSNVVVTSQKIDIPEHLKVISTDNMLEASLYPMTTQQFFKSIY